jgi:hypothetical protein
LNRGENHKVRDKRLNQRVASAARNSVGDRHTAKRDAGNPLEHKMLPIDIRRFSAACKPRVAVWCTGPA